MTGPASPALGFGFECGTDGRSRALRAARALFTARGYAEVSMQEIADVAAINKATLYHHFEDKEDLFVAIMAHEFDRASAGITAALGGDGPLRDRLERVAAYFLGTVKSDFSRLMTDVRIYVAPARMERFLQTSPPPWEALRPAVAAAVASGELRPVDANLVADLFFSMLYGRVKQRENGRDYLDGDADLARAIVDILLNGILPTAR